MCAALSWTRTWWFEPNKDTFHWEINCGKPVASFLGQLRVSFRVSSQVEQSKLLSADIPLPEPVLALDVLVLSPI